MTKGFKLTVVLVVVLLIIGEILGRFYGLTTYPLFRTDPDFEYIAAANQDLSIYCNKVIINEFSQRSLPLLSSDTLVYLLLGDSVVYGGNQIEQDSLASTHLERFLSHKMKKRVRVLNIAAKSWGPDNLAAYIRKYGLFKAKKVMLIVSSHDAYDNMSFEPVVGDSEHPDHNAPFALLKLMQKGTGYILDKLSKTKPSPSQNPRLPFNTGFDSLRKITTQAGIPLVIFHHLTINEIITQKLESGGFEIQTWCELNSLSLFQLRETPDMYLDDIHLNEKGQKHMAVMLNLYLMQAAK